MAQYHKVEKGEDFLTLAQGCDFTDYNILYRHPLNAKLVQTRPANQLNPGDIVFIPDKAQKQDPRATSKQHVFKIDTARAQLRIAVRYFGGEPLCNQRYALIFRSRTFLGTTNSNGFVSQEIEIVTYVAHNPETALLSFPDLKVEFTLYIGQLRPIKTVEGVQCRLNNLNFPCGKVDGVLGAQSAAALKEFQAWKGIEDNPSGKADDKTLHNLRKEHEDVE